MTPSPPRTGEPRDATVRAACAGTYDGTIDIVDQVVRESVFVPAWRPVRATAMMALAAIDAPRDQVWMHHAEFLAWMDRYFPLNKHKAVTMDVAVGIERRRRMTLASGAELPTKPEALACAHYALGLPLPIEPNNTEAFGAWFMGKFGAAIPVSRVLETHQSFIQDRIRGYDVNSGKRFVRLPGPQIIRALDWVWRVGPFSPYGDRLPAPPFPAAEETT